MCCVALTLSMTLSLALVALQRIASVDASSEELQAACDRKDAQSPWACLTLGRMYSEGLGVERDLARARALATRGCTDRMGVQFRSGDESRVLYQACFTAFLWGADTWRHLLGDKSEWEFVRDVVLAPSIADRRRLVARSREPLTLGEFLSPAYEEMKALPDLAELQEAVRARIVEIARTDPDPSRRSCCAEVFGYVLHFKVLEEMARSDPDPEVRRAAARARMEPELQIAAQRGDSATVLKATDPEVRRHGVEMLNDQAGLARAAQKDPDASVRGAAVRRLEDQKLLARIAEKDKDEGVRFTAAAAVKDAAVLERWAEEARNPEIRLLAVEQISNQAVLGRIAERDPEYPIREQAIRLLTNQDVLERIATGSVSGLRRSELAALERAALRATAVERLSDQGLLFELATKDREQKVCLAAIRGITDERRLAEIAARRAGAEVAQAVAARLTDQAVLRAFLEKQADAAVRVTAASRISDPGLAMQVATTDPVDAVQRMAVTKIVDQALLLKLAQSDAAAAARREAVSRLTDRRTLLELERTTQYPDVRAAVAENLVRDPVEAARYARTSASADIRRLAAGALSNQVLLAELATKDPDADVRIAAIKKLTDAALVAEIARSAVRADERAAATARLAELRRH
jgi:predicted regulator of amino acid metabolism with ACT domain